MKRWMTAGLALLASQAALGAVVINELHYNPADSQGTDDNYEFLELANTGASDVSVAGWTLTGVSLVFPAGSVVPAGGYLVVAKTPATVQAAYGISGVLAWSTGNLDNGGEWVRLTDASGSVVDEVNYDDATPWPTSPDGGGASLELLNPALDNSLAGSWAASSQAAGTPGARNSVYLADGLPGVADLLHQPLQPGTSDVVTVSALVSDDHGLASVTLRWSLDEVAQPALPMTLVAGRHQAQIGPFPEGSWLEVAVEAVDTAGQSTLGASRRFPVSDHAITDEILMFTEIQYTDACHGHADWVELHNAGATPLDLSGWIFQDNDDAHVFALPAGTTLAAGGYLVLSGGAAQLAADYGITGVVGDFDFGLSSGGDAVRLSTPWGVLVDAVEYSVTAPWPGSPVGTGPSLSLISPLLDNSQAASWAASGAPCGTPGLPNAADIWPPVLLRAGAWSAQRVRAIFDEPLDSASAQDEARWQLDGQPCAGALLVDSVTVELDFAFTFAPGQRHRLQVAGVADRTGNPLPATDWPFAVAEENSLVINEIFQNPSAVEEADGEWFELYNPGSEAVNLRAWRLVDDGTDAHLISPDADLVCPAGGYLVLAANGDSTLNGGVRADYVYSATTLTNGADEIVLLAGLSEVDRVAYDGGASFPDPEGASMELRGPTLDNNLGSAWRVARTLFGAGDLGTPGAANAASHLDAPLARLQQAGNQLTLRWNAVPGAARYRVEVRTGQSDWLPWQETTALELGALPDAPLRLYRVVALD